MFATTKIETAYSVRGWSQKRDVEATLIDQAQARARWTLQKTCGKTLILGPGKCSAHFEATLLEQTRAQKQPKTL